jgi:hypothetical protein
MGAVYEIYSVGIDNILKWICEVIIKKLKLRGLSPQANYTDRATAACLWS